MQDSIETLLESLNDYTIQSEQILQEGSNTIDRILHLQTRLNSIANCSGFTLSVSDRELIEKVKKINVTFEYKVATYSNIHNIKKYSIHAEQNIDFVIDAIKYHMDHPMKIFDKTEVNEEAIAETFKAIANSSFSKSRMSIDEFKDEYESFAFGGFKKKSITPNIMILIRLFEKSQQNISYINKYMKDHIQNLKKYYQKVEEKFNNTAKLHPEMTVSLNGYLACLETSIRNTTIMYNAIKQIYMKLNTEYRYIFNEVIHIDNELKRKSMNESIINLNESIDDITESIPNSDDPSKLSDTSKSLQDEVIKTQSKLSETLLKKIHDRETDEIDKIKILIGQSGIITKLNNSYLDDNEISMTIPRNLLNKIDMNYFISQLNNKIDFCKKQFEIINNKEKQLNINKLSIINDLLGDTFIWNDIEMKASSSLDIIHKMSDSALTKIYGEYIDTKISNLDYLYENIINIPDYLTKINNHIIEFDKLIIELLNKNTITYSIELKNLIDGSIIYVWILSCIYQTLFNFTKTSINLVQKLIDDVNKI